MTAATGKATWPERLLAAMTILLGASFAIPGARLLILGGSAYYVVAGIALLVAGVLLWRGRMAGAWLFVLVLGGTVLWALWEVGLDGWALLPRLDILLGLGLFIALAAAARVSRARLRLVAVSFVAIFAVAVLACTMMWRGPDTGDHVAPPFQIAGASPDWQTIGGAQGAQRYSDLTQITPANVNGLKPVWKVHLGLPPAGMIGSIEATPIKVGDTLYTCNTYNQIVALDAETGRIKWRFDPKIDREGVSLAACRGVTYYAVPDVDSVAPCANRVVQTTFDARLIEVDARDGKLCSGFGHGGEVDLRQGLGDVPKGYYYLTSPAVLVRGKLVIGSSVLDGQKTNEPSGVIRAFDAKTGAFAWAWDMGRPGDSGMPAPGQVFTRATPNAWAPMTGDDASGLVFAPLGNATPDYLAAHRSPIMNHFASSVVALDAATGKLRWAFQTTHRDVWDYDVASPPTLVNFPTPTGPRPAVIQGTKRGQIFVLDRMTGKPLVKTVERPAPQNPVPGERLSPTQPYSVGMPSMTGGRLSEASMWGVTPFDQLWCRIRFREARYDGDFTPIGVKPTIVFPSYMGGSNWSGVAVDPARGLLAVNVNYFAMYNWLIPRKVADAQGIRPLDVGRSEFSYVNWPQQGTAYAAQASRFMSPLGVPCTQPPYGELAVISLKTRQIVWRTPLGTARDIGPLGVPSMLPIPMGTPALGGSLMTKTGLLFIAATQERTFRAFDATNGKLLWQDRLPAGGHANPMAYYSARSGRQFIVIPASGHPLMANGVADYLVAYALPPIGRRSGN